ncbi:putative major intrinsic protein [Dioscorea sansibarensis]
MFSAIAEFLGTYVLIFIGCGSAFIDQQNNITIVGIALAWGVVITAMVYTFGHISGAHLNPAVTLAFASGLGFPFKQIPVYVISQFLGATLSSISLRALFKETSPGVMLTLPNSLQNDLTVIAWEIIISFILMLVICSAATDHRAPKELCGVAIGAAIFINVLIAGKVTGASMNPARSLGPAIAAKNYNKLWMYIVAPTIGTITASSVYKLLTLSPETKNRIGNKQQT